VELINASLIGLSAAIGVQNVIFAKMSLNKFARTMHVLMQQDAA